MLQLGRLAVCVYIVYTQPESEPTSICQFAEERGRDVSDERWAATHGRPTTNMPLVEPTGVPNLDAILGGGLARGSLIIVMGPPGSGKTILANQIAFAGASHGRSAMVLTALSESTGKLVTHMRSFRFFDEDLLGDRIQFLSMQQFLKQGLAGASDELIALARQGRAGMVVLDGFRGMRGTATDPQEAREFLYDMGTALSVIGATTIVTSEADPRDPALFPESTTADAIIGLHYEVRGVRQLRRIEAIKVRGAAPMPGLHGMAIGDRGIVVYPRVEARVAQESRESASERMLLAAAPENAVPLDAAESVAAGDSASTGRATFNLPELDTILNGGLNRNTSTMVFGSPGAGKTTLALRFILAGVENGERVLFLGFHETPQQLLMKADTLGVGGRLRDALSSGMLTLIRIAPVELNPDIIADQLLRLLDTTHAKRLIVDSVVELREAASVPDPGRAQQYLTGLMEAIRRRNVTAIFTREVRNAVVSELDFTNEPTSPMAENVLLLQQVVFRGHLRRVLSVLKMRFSNYDSTLREYTIAPIDGIRVLAPFESGEEMLAGIAAMQQGRDAAPVGARATRAGRQRGGRGQATRRDGSRAGLAGGSSDDSSQAEGHGQ